MSRTRSIFIIFGVTIVAWFLFFGPSSSAKALRAVAPAAIAAAVDGTLPLTGTGSGVSVTINSQRCVSNITVYDVVVRNADAKNLMLISADWKGTTVDGSATRAESTIPVVWVSRGEHVSGTVSFVSTEPIVTLTLTKILGNITISLTPPRCVR